MLSPIEDELYASVRDGIYDAPYYLSLIDVRASLLRKWFRSSSNLPQDLDALLFLTNKGSDLRLYHKLRDEIQTRTLC